MNIFKCSCGHYGFMEVDKEEDGVWFSFIEEPKNLWQRIKSFFKSKRYLSEICINDKDIKKLVKYLSIKNNEKNKI
jgi:hypothetical protein